MPALLIAALLLCPGVLGFAHGLSPCERCGPAGAPAPPVAHHGPAGEAVAFGADDSGYLAAVIALSGATLLGLLLGAPGPRGGARPRSVFRCLRPRTVAHHPRGPTPAFLQALRL